MKYNVATPIIHEDNTMSPAFRDLINTLLRGIPLSGDGSPEGVVDAPLFSVYLDKLGTTGSVQYVKMQLEIGGNAKQGWVLV